MAKYIADIPDTYVVKDGYVSIPFSLADSSDYMVETNIKVEPYDEEVKIGDEMVNKYNPQIKVCVTHLDDNDTFTGFAVKTVLPCCKCGEAYSEARLKSWEKTGKHYDGIAKVFDELQEGQDGED